VIESIRSAVITFSAGWRVKTHGSDMHKLAVAVLILVAVADTASARHRHRWQEAAPDQAVEQSEAPRDRRGLVPRNWQLKSATADEDTRRYEAPDEDAGLALYTAPAAQGGGDQHWKEVAFVDGEELTFLQRSRDKLIVYGFKDAKGDRLFFREAVLDCDGKVWRHISFEYPRVSKANYDPVVSRTARAFERQAGENCAETVGSGQRRSNYR